MSRDHREKRRSRSKSPSWKKSSKRSRSRSPRRSNKRSSHDRERSPSYRGGRRDREDRGRDSRDIRDRDRDRRGDRRDDKPKGIEAIMAQVHAANFDIDEQQKKLEAIMQQRRERIEKWRSEQSSKRGDSQTDAAENTNPDADQSELDQANEKKQWTLDDEDSEDEAEDMQISDDDERELILPKKADDDDDDKLLVEKKTVSETIKEETVVAEAVEKIKEDAKDDDEDEDDPLEAFMQGITAEVKKLRGKPVKEAMVGDKKISVVTGLAKKEKTAKIKGELLEQNQDAMEYSSEEEGATTAEDLTAMNTNLQQGKQKKVKAVTLEDISYQPFRKNFYIEVPELSNMTQVEVDAYKETMEGIKVKGKNCPRPIRAWAQAGVSKKTMDTLRKLGYEKPTPIQAQAVPAIMSGRDLIGIAKTGSGKTLAFLLPMIRHVVDQPPLEPGEGPIAIVMTPTRELATQIWAEARKFAKGHGLRTVAVYGGTPISEQIGELKPGAEIVVCTPGRMIDMLAANSGRVTNLKRCTYIVLDEADRMFDMGFEPQVMRIIDGIRPDRQTVMFSATFPRIMESLARRILEKPIEVMVGGRSVVAKEIKQTVMVIEEDDKFLKLLEILGRHLDGDQSAIVFVDKQEAADGLLKELMHASYSCFALHGGIDQMDRDSTIADFKAGRVKVLIATSVAARGLDVRSCILVVNYDCPNHYEDYVHRCGRTGRAGNTGYAYTFLNPDQGRYASDIIKAFELSNVEVPEEIKRLWNSYKLSQELMGKKVKGGGGFSGKGFKFDEAEANLNNEKKKFQKAALGLQDSDDDEEADMESDILKIMAPKQSVKQISASGAPIHSNSSNTNPGPGEIIGEGGVVFDIKKKIEMAKQLASKINATKAPSNTTEAFLKGQAMNESYSNALAAKSLAEQRAERLHAKLNYIPRDVEYNEDGDMIRAGRPLEQNIEGEGGLGDGQFQRFEEELEINEFPQQARWRVTSREALAQISEYSEAGLTVRGTFYPPGSKVPEGERKLYLAIEGTNELAVSKAKAEIIRLIKEELQKLQNNGPKQSMGRYKVL